MILRMVLVALAALPAVVLRLTGTHPPEVAGMLVFGAGVVAAAVVLLWAAETARADISGALALALLALIAVLPEYAVDLYFAYTAGTRPEYTAYAAANMTGANRLLVGVGWALVAVAFAFGSRRRGSVRLEPHRRTDLGFLMVAGVLAFVMPLTRQIGWYASVVLILLYLGYLWRIARGGSDGEEMLVGVPARLVRLPKPRRRTVTVLLFVIGAVIVFVCAEPFATSLVDAGASLGVDRFLLVQWLAPLASEAPELLVAIVFAWRGRGDDALGALLSSKVNQWTLLVGSLPIAYALGGGGAALPLDGRQVEEVLLTAAQTMLGIAVLLDLRFRNWEAGLLFVLFGIQFVLPDQHARMALSYVYLAIALVLLVVRRRDVLPSLRAIGR